MEILMRKLITEWDKSHWNMFKDTKRGALAKALSELEHYEKFWERDKKPSLFWRMLGEKDGYTPNQRKKLEELEAVVVQCEQEWKAQTERLAAYELKKQEIEDDKTPF